MKKDTDLTKEEVPQWTFKQNLYGSIRWIMHGHTDAIEIIWLK